MSAFSASASIPAPTDIEFETFTMPDPENGIPAGYSLGTSLGKGEFGEAHQFVKLAHVEAGRPENMGVHIELQLPDGRQTVLKKVNLVHHNEHLNMIPIRLQQFKDEVIVGNQLGLLGIAPRIYNWWICENTEKNDKKTKRYGYYVMDTLSGVWASKFGKNVAVAPFEAQQQLIRNVIIMVQNGFIHQDLHTGNVGFVVEDGSEKVVLFDFGLTLKVDSAYIEEYGSMLVASQLYQMIEQSDIADIIDRDNYVFNVIQYIVQNPSTPLSRLLSNISAIDVKIPAQGVNIHAFGTKDFDVKQYNDLSVTKSTIKTIINQLNVRKLPSPIAEAILMLGLYNILIHTQTKDQMYGYGKNILEKNFLYNVIYLIRNNKITIAQVEEWLDGIIIPETLNSLKPLLKNENVEAAKKSSKTTTKYRIGIGTRGGKRSGKSKTKKKRRSKTRKTRR